MDEDPFITGTIGPTPRIGWLGAIADALRAATLRAQSGGDGRPFASKAGATLVDMALSGPAKVAEDLSYGRAPFKYNPSSSFPALTASPSTGATALDAVGVAPMGTAAKGASALAAALKTGAVGAKEAGYLIPIIAGRNKMPSAARDIESRALSAAQMHKAGADDSTIWRALHVDETPRTAASSVGDLEGRFRHEIPVSEELFSPYGTMARQDKIDALIDWADKTDDPRVREQVLKVVDRWALDPLPPGTKGRAPTMRWHSDPALQAMDRETAARRLDAAPGGLKTLGAMQDLESNAVPLRGTLKAGTDLDLDTLHQQYPELARLGYKAFPDLKLPGLGDYGSYDLPSNTVVLNPAAMLGASKGGFNPYGVVVHETGHGIQQHFGSPGGANLPPAMIGSQQQQAHDIAKELRGYNDPEIQKIGVALGRSASLSPMERYRLVYGEADARNMAKRALLTDYQRAVNSPRDTMDVNPEHLIDWETIDSVRQLVEPGGKWYHLPPADQASALVKSLRNARVLPRGP